METDRNENSIIESAEEKFATYLAENGDGPSRSRSPWSRNPERTALRADLVAKLKLFKYVLGTISRSPGISQFNAHRWADRIIAEEPPSYRYLHPNRAYKRLSYLGNITLLAIALTFVVLGSGYWIYNSNGEQSATTDPFLAATTYATAKGEQSLITLPDGSTVLLNVDSKLEVSSGFDKDNRDIRLNGEALFNVVHRSVNPFTVNAGKTVSKVMGTTFTVRHYSTDSITSVAVRNGKVAVNDVVVTPNQLLTVNKDRQSYVSIASDAQFAFADGVLTIEDIPLSHVIPSLNRWYDVEIVVVDTAMMNQRLNAAFKSRSRSELVEFLGFVFSTRIEQNGKTITLYPR